MSSNRIVVGESCGEGPRDVCRSDDEGWGVEEEGLDSSSDDDADGIVDMVVRGKRTRTRNPRVFNDDFL